ncbi:MAG: glycoside hydrolase family 16 protein [Alkalibacterium sp.]|nr:glycoside hydrolase family 16 protein [Alkalibacterium sp.]
MKKNTVLISVGLVTILALISYRIITFVENRDLGMKEEERTVHMLADLTFDSSVYTLNESLNFTVDLTSQSAANETLWIGFSIKGQMGTWIDFPSHEVTSDANQTKTLSFSEDLNDLDRLSTATGPHKAVIALWDSNPLDDTSRRLDFIEVPEAFRLYHTVEEFSSIDDDIWFSRDGVLGRTHLRNENVFTGDDYLTIRIPSGTLDGGEIQTLELVHYGSYEISMKLPDAPSSITGFFLYRAPDFHHEIDIEVFNQPDSEVLFTTYSDGTTQNEDRQPLDYDPTADFHQYRIDYFPGRTSFYIDDQLMQEWEKGLTDEPMHLMVNTWFPSWLEGIAPESDQLLEIKWIRY